VIHRPHHLHDERLLEGYMAERDGERLDPLSAEHLSDCESCAARYDELSRLMDSVRNEGESAADAVFTPERLRQQQQQIARRIEHLGRPARVLSFPQQLVRHTMTASAPRSMLRWIAGAAAAGLFVGIALGASYGWQSRGRLNGFSNLAGSDQSSFGRGLTLARANRPAPLRVVGSAGDGHPLAARGADPDPDTAADDAFLSDLDVALERPRTRELRAFDAFTPHVREVRDVR